MESVLDVSVIVPCHNRLELAEPVLRGFVAQIARCSAELVVVDDGSQPPVAALLDALGRPPGVRLVRHDRRRGTSAARNTGLDAATGEILLLCDSDTLPGPDFVADHLAFHRANPERGASHLGRLDWGCDDPGLFGRLVGARGNPRLLRSGGRLDWTQWFTDNWSVKRSLLDAGPYRFDPAFTRWGWEDLDLGWRLARAGGTNTLSGRARASHLKRLEIEDLRCSFRRSVPNLLLLARRVDDPQVRDWLGLGIAEPSVLAACEQALDDAWSCCLELERTRGDLVEGAGPLAHELGVALSDAVFRVGIARGLRDEGALEPTRELGAKPPADAARVVDMGTLLAAVAAVSARVGADATPRLERQLRDLARSLPGVEPALADRVRSETRHLRKRAQMPAVGATP